MRMRKAWLRAIAAASLGAVVAAGPGAARGEREVTVVDADGRRVGPAVSLDLDTGLAAVAVQAGDRVGLVWVATGGFAGGSTEVLFASPDCSGPPLLAAGLPFLGLSADPLFTPTGLMSGELLLRAADLAAADTAVRSSWSGVPPACLERDQTVAVLPAALFIDLAGRFRAPFTAR
jgi:hypothetical protein